MRIWLVIVVCALETWLMSCMMTGEQLSKSDQHVVGMTLLAVIWANGSRAGLGCKFKLV